MPEHDSTEPGKPMSIRQRLELAREKRASETRVEPPLTRNAQEEAMQSTSDTSLDKNTIQESQAEEQMVERSSAPTEETPENDTDTQEPGTNLSTPNTANIAKESSAKTPSNPFYLGGAGPTVTFLREAQNDPESIAKQIARGEFSKSGAGIAGSIFRSAMDEPIEAMDSVWGEVLALGASLWDKDKRDESLLMLQTAVNSFYIPPAWEKEISAALETAKDYQTIQEVEKAFEVGSDKDARTLARTIQDPEAALYQEDLENRITKRQRSRKIAFAVGGVAIAGLLSISVIGLMTAERLFQNPPTISFDGMGDALEDVSRALRDERAARDQQRQTTETPQMADPLATPNMETTNNSVEQTPTPPETVPSNPVNALLEEQSVPETENTTPNPQPDLTLQEPEQTNQTSPQDEATFRPVETQTQPTQETTPDTTAPTQNTEQTTQPAPQESQTTTVDANTAIAEQEKQDCIMGYAVLAQAQIQQEQQPTFITPEKINNFTQILENACAGVNLSAMELLQGTQQINPADIQAGVMTVFGRP